MPKPSPRVAALIRKLGLRPHPEGGFYREIHRSAGRVKTPRGERSALTTIYFLLPRGAVSLFHRVESDEIWHHYEGSPLRLLDMDGGLEMLQEYRLGPLAGKRQPVAVIPRGHWQAAESLGDYTLAGCSVGPGFDFQDFALIDEGRGERLAKARPRLARFARRAGRS